MALHIKEDASGNKRILTEDEFTSEKRVEDTVVALGKSTEEFGGLATAIGYILMLIGTAVGWYWFVKTSDMFILFRIFVGLLVGVGFGGALFWASLMLLGKKK
jgi:hypothetical protein